jgi:site-specific DNA recombinase
MSSPAVLRGWIQWNRIAAEAGAQQAHDDTTPLPSMHPNLAEVYRAKVAGLQEALTASPDNTGVLERLRDLVDRVDIGPGTDRDQPEIVLTGALAAMLKLTMPDSTALAASGHGELAPGFGASG